MNNAAVDAALEWFENISDERLSTAEYAVYAEWEADMLEIA